MMSIRKAITLNRIPAADRSLRVTLAVGILVEHLNRRLDNSRISPRLGFSQVNRWCAFSSSRALFMQSCPCSRVGTTGGTRAQLLEGARLNQRDFGRLELESVAFLEQEKASYSHGRPPVRFSRLCAKRGAIGFRQTRSGGFALPPPIASDSHLVGAP